MTENDEQNLLLYMIPGSYFCDMSLLALHEKKLSFKTHFVNLYKFEQCEPWFQKLNAKCEVPVLQHGEKLVPGSDHIFLYLDEKFCSHGVPRLLPAKGSEALRKVEKFIGLFGTIRNAVLTFGNIRFPQLSTGLLVPDYEQKLRLKFVQYRDELMKAVVNRFPEISELASEKRARYDSLSNKLHEIAEVEKEINSVAAILDQVEVELASHKGDTADWWLCCDQFTSADVLFTIILHRLKLLGLSSSLLLPDKRPCIIAYKSRIEKRHTFKSFLLHLARLHKEFESNIM